MNGLLLGTIALRKFIAGEAVLHDWLKDRNDPLHLSVISVAEVMAQSEALTDVIQRQRWTERLTVAIPADFGPRLHAFDITAAIKWSALRATLIGQPFQLVESDLSVVAIALCHRLEYIAPREDWHDQISKLRQQDPWAGKSYPT